MNAADQDQGADFNWRFTEEQVIVALTGDLFPHYLVCLSNEHLHSYTELLNGHPAMPRL